MLSFEDLRPKETSPTVTRGVIPTPKKSPTDFYMTKGKPYASIISEVNHALNAYGNATIHSLGAANYHALKVALMIKKQRETPVKTEITTGTVSTHDFAGTDISKTKDRQLNSVTITIKKE